MGVNYMVIGDPGVGKTTVVPRPPRQYPEEQPQGKVLFISAEMTEIDLASTLSAIRKSGNRRFCSSKAISKENIGTGKT